MGIKVTTVGKREWKWIRIICLECKRENYTKAFTGQQKGDVLCIGCGRRFYWEETEDEPTV